METGFSSYNYDIERIKSIVGRYFPFYEFKVGIEAIAFYCRVDKDTLEENFESLRKSLSEYRYIPILKYEGGENVIYIIKKQKKREVPIWVNVVLLISTIVTTALTGALIVSGENNLWDIKNFSAVLTLNNLINGTVLFSLPLLTILGVHEMGHYVISKMHGIATSLPFFIPVPPVFGFNIGTFGALISSRDPLSNRKILFDVGISGPLSGFIVAVPITIFGVITSSVVPITDISKGGFALGSSLFFEAIYRTFLSIPSGYTVNLNPIAFAGWVGLLITSINLFPAGQLDGGHIARAVLGDKQKYAGWLSLFVMFLFPEWWFFAIFVLLTIGAVHPPPLNDISDIDLKRKILFVVAIVILVACFVPSPIQ